MAGDAGRSTVTMDVDVDCELSSEAYISDEQQQPVLFSASSYSPIITRNAMPLTKPDKPASESSAGKFGSFW